METIMIAVDDPEILRGRLANEGLEQNIIRARSGMEAQAIILALGGGVGIAAVIRSIGRAVHSYFEGRVALAQAEKETIRISAKGQSFECSAGNVESILNQLLAQHHAGPDLP